MFSNKIEKNFIKKKEEMNNYINTDELKNYSIKIVKYDETNDSSNILEVANKEKPSNRLLANYTIAGYYNIVSSIWIWGWINPYVEKNMREKLKSKVKNSSLLKEIKDDKNKELYNYFMTEDTMYISGENIDELIKFILYISEGEWVVSRKQSETNDEKVDVLEILVIDKIIQNK